MHKLQTHLITNNLQICSHCEHESYIADGKPICGLTRDEIHFFKDGYQCPVGKFTVKFAGTYSKFRSLVQSVSSGRAIDDVIAQRKEQCCDCPELVREGEGQYCGACGCPKTAVSELSTKLTFAYLECPLAKPGFSNHKPPEEGV